MNYCENSEANVVFGREFPQKNVAECLFRHILQDTFFFVKWRNVQLCMQINFITKCFIYCSWFFRNNSISGATSLKALRKESLGPQNCKRTKSSSINQVCKFLLDFDPHWYFGKVAPPNYETTLFGVNGPPKGGLGGNNVSTPIDHKEKPILYIFPSWVMG